jgi:hypothetical protein
MARERRKRVRHSSRRLSQTALEKRLCFLVMDGHRILKYEPVPIVMKNRCHTLDEGVLANPFALEMRTSNMLK